MNETREQIIEQMAQAHFNSLPDDAQRFWDVDDAEGLLAVMGDGLPVAVKAVTDRVRELHRGHECHALCFIIHGGHCAKVGACQQCGVQQPCPTVRLLDQIDAELGGER